MRRLTTSPMRIATRILLSFALLSFGLAGSAWALPFTPDPVSFSFSGDDDDDDDDDGDDGGNGIVGFISGQPDADPTHATFKITLTSGKLARLDFLVTSAAGVLRQIEGSTGTGSTGGDGAKIRSVKLKDRDKNGLPDLAKFKFRGLKEGRMTGSIFVDFFDLQVGDVGVFTARGSSQQLTVTFIPEPSTALLLALGLAALAMWRRRV